LSRVRLPHVGALRPLRLAFVFAAILAAPILVAPAVIGPVRAETPAIAAERLEVVTAKARTSFEVEIVDTEESRARGLMFRRTMADDHGMLFDFRREEPVWFWMKNTYLPLDMIFARADGTIVSIARDATPLSEAPIAAGGPVRFVLEVNAGLAARLGLAPGDRLVHPRIRVGP
jgi:uncharacterized membrane protein (UPF0127 family)